MADLLQPVRRGTQQRVTNNRDTVLPARRDTDAPNLVVRSDLRTASRGDGGAAEIRRALDGFMSAGESAFNAQTRASAPKYAAEAAEGSLAASSGAEPDAARAKSISYQEAFYKVKAEASFNTFNAQTRTAVEEALNNDASPEEVHAIILGGIKDYTDGIVDDIPTASAQRATAIRIATMGSELDTFVNAKIKERNKEEIKTTQGGNISTFLAAWTPLTNTPEGLPEAPGGVPVALDPELDGLAPADPLATDEGLDVVVTARRSAPLPVEEWISTYRQAGFSPAEAKAETINSVTAAATNRDEPRPELLEALLDSKQADGKTPSLNSSEIIQVQNSLSQARNLEEKVETDRHNDARDDKIEGLFTRALAGEIVDADVIAAGRDGTFTPQETAGTLGLLNGLRSSIEDGQVNDAFVATVERRIAMGNPMSNSEILAAEAAGRFGTGLSAKRAATQALITPARLRGSGGEGGSETARDRVVLPSGMTRKEERKLAWEELSTELYPEDRDTSPLDRRQNAYVTSYFNSLQDGRRGRLPPQQALAQTRVYLREFEASRARTRAGGAPRPAPLPTGRTAVQPGSYSWGSSGQRQ